MIGLIEWLVTLIIFVLVIGVLYYILKRALALWEVNAKVAEMINLVVLLLIVLVFIAFIFTGGGPIFHFPQYR